ncbi:MAG: glutamine synthetase III [Oscillospiraceae bacterium]|nr:glutamine synthetase III [Oscillospiraceae bacterium]
MDISDIFGKHVFSEAVMQRRLPKQVYQEVTEIRSKGGHLSMAAADALASAMKDWAIEHGATHFSHWFQPLTGSTAEKHEAFLSPLPDGSAISKLSGKQLIMSESDASSFPSGGLRSTHYARGYTAWDITSPVFIKESAAGPVLCIPTSFVSYTGEALDQKTPLLRSMEAVNKQALRIVRLFGNKDAQRVIPYVGPEQEYFLVDRQKYLKRRDLIYTGRTLFGAPAPKGQELDDQYLGSIRERIGSYMSNLNQELWKLGITASAQHNEVAPGQHEMAPIYTVANVAVDHNQLTMETMKRVAYQHGLVCLLHEKPFAGVNGSGKHNNYSLGTDTGMNLFDPGETPNENLQFLLVLSCVMRAVDEHADLLRNAASDVGNDHRLGANEAPPAIISIFLGEQLENVVSQIVDHGDAATCLHGERLDVGVSTMPVLHKDATDRNRTSPFAFTGNKFEFRMVGSADSIASPNTVLNTILAEAFSDVADLLESSNDFEGDCKALIARQMKEHVRIIFNGNSYSEEWVEEAARRGLPNLPSMVASIPCLTQKKNVQLFEKFGVLSQVELESRAEILYETYAKSINIEAMTMLHMAGKHYIPTVIGFVGNLAASINEIRSACPDLDLTAQEDLLRQCQALLNRAMASQTRLQALTAKVNAMERVEMIAGAFHDEVVPAMEELRQSIDALELLVDKDVWPVPTYGDLMFEV